MILELTKHEIPIDSDMYFMYRWDITGQRYQSYTWIYFRDLVLKNNASMYKRSDAHVFK